jgi:hypothetical protein
MNDKLLTIIVIVLLSTSTLSSLVGFFKKEPAPIRTEQDIRNEIELEAIRRDRDNFEQLIKVDEEIVKIYEDSLQHNHIDVDLLNADRAKRDSLRAVINPV